MLQHGFTLVVHDQVALGVVSLDPVLQIQTNAASHPHGCQENGGNAIGSGHNRGIVDEGDKRTGLFPNPQGHIVDTRHA